jgi:hypothetical protein
VEHWVALVEERQAALIKEHWVALVEERQAALIEEHWAFFSSE